MQVARSELARPALAMSMAIAKEIQRRDRAKHFRSSVIIRGHPIHQLLTKQARYKVFYGGRGGIKSWGIAEALVRKADAGFERILCAREFQNSIKDSVHKLLKDTIERMGLDHRFDITQTSIRNKITGAEFIFKGLHHNYNEIKSMEGITIVWIEEAQYVSEDSWKVLIPTIRTEGKRADGKSWYSEIWVSFNTPEETAPTYKRFITNRPPNSIVELVNFDKNPYFPKVLREEMEYQKKVDYQAYLHIWEGHPKKISDALVLGGKYRVDAFPDDLWRKAKWERLFYGGDFGYAQDPSTLIRFFIVGNTLYIEYEAWKVKCDLDKMDELYATVPGSKEWPIKADNARPETIAHIKTKFHYKISAADKWKGSVEDGIAHIRGFDEVVIHPRCVHTIQEAGLWSYKTDPHDPSIVLPVLIDKHNHCWDAVRYGLDGHIKRRGKVDVQKQSAVGDALALAEIEDNGGSATPWNMGRRGGR